MSIGDKLNNTIRFLVVLLAICVTVSKIYSQQWSDPILVASQSGSCGPADFYVSESGTIHCVWPNGTEPYNVYYIYYSKSIDNGQTWSVPVNISGNTSNRMLSPRVVADANDNVYVTFMLNQQYNTLQLPIVSDCIFIELV